MIKKIKIEGTLGTVFYIAVGIFLALGINQGLAFALSTDMPVVAVESNSMVPTFYKGDILIIQGIADPNLYSDFLEIGDVIVFSPEGKATPIVHRLIGKNIDGTFQTMGDANNGRQLPFEKSIEPSQIHGKMLFIIPFLGWIKIGATEILLPNIGWVVLAVVTVTFLYLIIKK
ncbi:MAG: signal peptidase I [Candidatus Aenigmarchaeota archaeon]|nr:signal peptidase I [Candidatus Aenigmarchaeota archaeon]